MEPGGTDCIPPTLLGVILSLIKCNCLSLSLKIIPFTFSVDYLSQLEWCIWHQCSESVRVGRAGLNPSIPTQYYALFLNGRGWISHKNTVLLGREKSPRLDWVWSSGWLFSRLSSWAVFGVPDGCPLSTQLPPSPGNLPGGFDKHEKLFSLLMICRRMRTWGIGRLLALGAARKKGQSLFNFLQMLKSL